jgi:HTH-type transcriptional regulator/antitoxin HigA
MSYQPNKAIHPGSAVGRTLDKLGMSQKSLSERTGITEKHISAIINGDASITPETAALFANALGGKPSFWNNLQKNYEETKVRLENQELAAKEVELVQSFPYLELKKRGYVKDTRIAVEKVLELWRFFGVNSLSSVKLVESTAWRRGATEQVKAESLAAWLRCGELGLKELVDNLGLKSYDEAGLKQLLPKLRAYTTPTSSAFWRNLQEELANVGVALIAIKHFSGTRANGATRWIGGNPVIQLSAYGRDADKVWFTLFHEIGHVLKHGKRDKFISFNNGKEKSTEELEADNFAADTLISKNAYDTFVINGDYSKEAIVKFSNNQGIHPGIVVGRLKNHRLIGYGAHHDLHGKLIVEEAKAEA